MSHQLVIVKDTEDDWSVWMSLPDHDPLRDAFGFVIGSGTTRDAAVANAVRELESEIEQLQGPIGVVEQREV